MAQYMLVIYGSEEHWDALGEEEEQAIYEEYAALSRDLFVASLPLLPVRLVQLLREREATLVQVPEEEFESLAANVLALGPRSTLALAGNDETRRRMEAVGVDVRTYAGEELSLKGDGGPTCLTLPLLRAG